MESKIKFRHITTRSDSYRKYSFHPSALTSIMPDRSDVWISEHSRAAREGIPNVAVSLHLAPRGQGPAKNAHEAGLAFLSLSSPPQPQWHNLPRTKKSITIFLLFRFPFLLPFFPFLFFNFALACKSSQKTKMSLNHSVGDVALLKVGRPNTERLRYHHASCVN